MSLNPVGCDFWYSALAILNAGIMVFSFTMHGRYISRPDGIQILHGILEDEEKFHLKDTPVLVIFTVACLCHAGWVLYSLALMCKTNPPGSNFLPFPVLVLGSFASLVGIFWLLQVDFHNATWACVTQLVVFVSLLTSLVIAYRGLGQMYPHQPGVWDVRHLWLNRILVHNGVAFQAAWSVELAIINMGLAFVYSRWLLPWEAAILTMSLLGVGGFTFTLLDIFILKRWTRYTLSHNVLHLMVSMAMSIWWKSSPAIVILISAITLLLLKIIALKSSCSQALK